MRRAIAILTCVVAAAQTGAAAQAPRLEGEEPEEMIDFLGRRSECPDHAADEAGAQSEDSKYHWDRLSCATLVAEEAIFRAKYAMAPDVIAMLDDKERVIRRDALLMSADGIAGAETRYVEQTGTDASGQHEYRLVADARVLDGAQTRITVFINGKETGSVLLANRLFERLDLQTLRTNYDVQAGRHWLQVTANYGWPREYCYQNHDARPLLSFFFSGSDEPSVSRQGFVNCSPNHESVTPEELIGAAPRARSGDKGTRG